LEIEKAIVPFSVTVAKLKARIIPIGMIINIIIQIRYGPEDSFLIIVNPPWT
jgi:hypothetical protein